MLSVIIPSVGKEFLNKTAEDLLINSRGEIEIIMVLDGYWTEPLDDARVKVLHLGKSVGMRDAINAGVSIAKGDYLMRVDDHCSFGESYDTIITEHMDQDWIVTPRRYFFDPYKWEVMDIPYVDYEKLIIDPTHNKFTGVTWKSRDRKRKDIMIDETMAMQGSVWFMSHHHWDTVIKELDSEHYGTHYQDSHEMIFKTWKMGGKAVLNKNTWFAHKHRKFPRAHNLDGDASKASFEYALSIWRDYYENEVRPKWKI